MQRQLHEMTLNLTTSQSQLRRKLNIAEEEILTKVCTALLEA